MNIVPEQARLGRQLNRPKVGAGLGVAAAHLKAVQIVVGVNVVVARSLLKIGASDREGFIQIDVPETAEKVDLIAAAQAARLDAVELDVIQLRLIVDIQD